MKLLAPVHALEDFTAKLLSPLQALALLAARVHVSWVFLKSGWLKYSSWETTLALFQDEYRVPLLSPFAAAVAGTAGELLFPALLIVGLWSRLAALGLFAVNALAVYSYYHVIGAAGFEAALGQHLLWAVLIGGIALFGPGRWSLDGLWRWRR